MKKWISAQTLTSSNASCATSMCSHTPARRKHKRFSWRVTFRSTRPWRSYPKLEPCSKTQRKWPARTIDNRAVFAKQKSLQACCLQAFFVDVQINTFRNETHCHAGQLQHRNSAVLFLSRTDSLSQPVLLGGVMKRRRFVQCAGLALASGIGGFAQQ